MTLFILDSDHLSLYQQGHKSLRQHILTLQPTQIAITIVSVEELIRGRLAQIRRATKPQSRLSAYHWLSETLDFLCKLPVLKYNRQADQRFEILRAQKIRIGTQDLRIAAIALSQNAVLVTRNRRDFEKVPDLVFQDWSDSP